MSVVRYLVAVDDCFMDRPAGAARVAWDIAQAVHEQGSIVRMVCLSDESSPESYTLEDIKGIQVLRIRPPALPRWSPFRLTAVIERVTQIVRGVYGNKPWDLLHMHSCRTGLGTANALPDSVRIVKTLHSPMELEYLSNHNDAPFLHKIKTWLGLPRLRSLERKELDISSALHVLSHFTRGELTKLHARLPETKVIPHWRQPERKRTVSKEEARDKLGWRTDIPIFFTLRHHGPRNGIDTAIRAVAPLANRDQCQFMIGGKGALLAYHQKLAASLHPGTNIQLLGRMSEEDLILAYQAADAFLLPTRALECFGLIILEAYSYGCPVIGTNVGAIPELLQPISPQLLCPPDDVAHWQWKLERFLDGSLTTPTPEALIEYVDTHFGKQEVTKSILRWLGGTQLHQLWKPTQGLKIKGVLS